MTPETQALRCAAVWRSPLAGLTVLEEATWRTASPPGIGLVGRRWQDRQATWVPDVLMEPDPDPRRQAEGVGEPVHGWFGFPVWAGGDVIGVVEFFSREVRQPDEELLQMTRCSAGSSGDCWLTPKDARSPQTGRLLPVLGHAHGVLRGHGGPFRVPWEIWRKRSPPLPAQ
jgi:hypothetical protein